MKKIPHTSSFLVFALIAAFLLGGKAVSAQAQPQPGPFDVRLSKTLLTMPGNGFFTNNDVPLSGAKWFNGYFAVSSACSGNNNSKGLWIFKEDGTLVDLLNTCRDAGEDTHGSGAHSWSTPPNVQPIGGNQFVKEMGQSNARPPLLYKISGDNVSFVSRPWRSSFNTGEFEHTADNVAAIPGYAVTLELQVTGAGSASQNIEYKNVLYRLPSWSVVDEMDAVFVPLSGVGDYILGTPSGGNQDIVLYKVSDDELELVERIDTDFRPTAVAVDAASSDTRVGLLSFNAPGASRNSVQIYNVGADGLTLERTVNLSDTASYSNTNSLSISGEYIAFLDCGLPAMPAPASGAADNESARTCGVGVFKGNTRLSVERLPHATTISSNSSNPVEIYQPPPYATAISADGKDLLAVSIYGAYMYEIGTASGTTPILPPLSPTQGPGGIQLQNISDYLSFVEGYLRLLQALSMGNNGASISAQTKSTATTSPFTSIFDDAVNLINSLGQ